MSRTHYKPLIFDDFSGGIDRFLPPDNLLGKRPNCFRDSRNFRCADGDLLMRPGSAKWNAAQWNAGETCKGLFRYYYGGTKKFLTAGGTSIWASTGASPAYTAIQGSLTGLTQATFAQFRDLAYIAHDSSAAGIVRYNGTTAVKLEDTTISVPASAPTVTPSYDTILSNDATTGWTSSDAVNFTLSADTATKVEGDGCLKIDGAESGSDFDRIVYDYGAGNTQNWETITQLTFRARVTQDSLSTGMPNFQLRFAFSESLVDDLSSLPGHQFFTLNSDGNWHEYTFNISSVAADARNAVRYLYFKVAQPGAAFDLYIDAITATGSLPSGDERVYAFAYVDTTPEPDKYSLLSPVSVVVQNGGANLQNIVAGARSSEAAVENIRIYRSKAGADLTSANVALFLVAEISNPASGAWSYTDKFTDNQLGGVYNEYAASGVQAPPTDAYILALREDRMYYAGSSSEPSRVWMSNWQDPETCPTVTLPTNADAFDDTVGGYLDIAPENGQAVTALIAFPGGMLIGKEQSAYVISGKTFNPFGAQIFRYDLVSDVAGIVGPWAGCLCETTICWVGRDTVWAWNASQGAVNIGKEIADIIKAIPSSYQKYVACIYHDSKLIIAYTATGGTYNTEWLEYDFRSQAWSRYDGQNRSQMVVAKNPGDNNELYFGDANAAYIWQAETGTADGSTAITGKYLSPIITGGADTLRLRYCDVIADGTTAAVTATLSVYRNKSAALGDSADATASYALQGTGARVIEASLADSNTAHRFQLAITVAASEALRIRSFLAYLRKVR